MHARFLSSSNLLLGDKQSRAKIKDIIRCRLENLQYYFSSNTELTARVERIFNITVVAVVCGVSDCLFLEYKTFLDLKLYTS